MNSTEPHADCIFCGIANGRLPASVVYQDTDWLAVMDIHPIRKGHVLLVPRRHVGRLTSLSGQARRELIVLADEIVRAQEAGGYAADGSNLLLNDGIAANQHIPHLHLHCIPRRPGDTAGFGMRLLARTFGLFGRATARDGLDATAQTLAGHLSPDPLAAARQDGTSA